MNKILIFILTIIILTSISYAEEIPKLTHPIYKVNYLNINPDVYKEVDYIDIVNVEDEPIVWMNEELCKSNLYTTFTFGTVQYELGRRFDGLIISRKWKGCKKNED